MAGIFEQLTGTAGTEGIANANELETAEVRLNSDGLDEQAGVAASAEASNRTEQRLRDASQELLRFGLLEEAHKPNLYRVAVVNMVELNSILEPLDLLARADDVRGLVYILVRKDHQRQELDDWAHPLVRKQRLTLEQSLLVAILRQHFIAYEQEAGTGASQAIVAIDELIPMLQVFLGETGSEAKERNRMMLLLDQLKGHGLVSAPDSHERVVIRPMIAHLANPENLQALLNDLRQQLAAENQTGQQDSQV